MEKIIKAAIDRGASDLHIKAGDVFRARINGRLVPGGNGTRDGNGVSDIQIFFKTYAYSGN